MRSFEGGKKDDQKVSGDQPVLKESIPSKNVPLGPLWILVSPDKGDSNKVNPDNFKKKMSASTKQ